MIRFGTHARSLFPEGERYQSGRGSATSRSPARKSHETAQHPQQESVYSGKTRADGVVCLCDSTHNSSPLATARSDGGQNHYLTQFTFLFLQFAAYLKKLSRSGVDVPRLMRTPRRIVLLCCALALLLWSSPRTEAQAALLLEEPYGFFGTLNPTGHTAIYFARICADGPTKLRRCEPGELGSVISRYSDVAHHDWVVIPLIPYLYSVEDESEVPAHVDREMVRRLRNQYHEAHLLGLGRDVRKGDFWHGGWTQLVGVSYERRMYAFRFDTTEAQDDAFIARMNRDKNRSHFQLLYNNCADFSRKALDQYFPRGFRRSFFPDAGMTTPKQITHKLVKYAQKHPEIRLDVYEIPQVPGYRRMSRKNKSISESLITTGYAVPIAFLNPYLAGGLFADYILHGRYHLIPKNPPKLDPDELMVLTLPGRPTENPLNAREQVHSAAAATASTQVPASAIVDPGLKETMASHE